MIAFAKRAEDNGEVPGGSFWISANGNTSKVTKALAEFAQSLKGAMLRSGNNMKLGIVLAVLREALAERNGRWLLCIDHVEGARDADVRGILGEVSSLAAPERSNGWVVFTSRCGRPLLWSGMYNKQNVVLDSISVEDDMCLLWRYRESILTANTPDESVSSAVTRFKNQDEMEYQALLELCGYGWQRSLAGLPIALTHAGAHILQMKCTFSSHLQLYWNANVKSKLEAILEGQGGQGSTLEEVPRPIFETWTESMSGLSIEALFILKVFRCSEMHSCPSCS